MEQKVVYISTAQSCYVSHSRTGNSLSKRDSFQLGHAWSPLSSPSNWKGGASRNAPPYWHLGQLCSVIKFTFIFPPIISFPSLSFPLGGEERMILILIRPTAAARPEEQPRKAEVRFHPHNPLPLYDWMHKRSYQQSGRNGKKAKRKKKRKK